MAAPDDAERRRIAARQVLRGHAARGSRPKGAELVSLDHGHELGRLRVEETDDESGPFRRRRVQLAAGEAEPAVGGRHVGERALWKPKAAARRDLDLAGGHAPEARLDRLDGVRRLEKRGDVGLAQVERHGREVYERLGAPS